MADEEKTDWTGIAICLRVLQEDARQYFVNMYRGGDLYRYDDHDNTTESRCMTELLCRITDSLAEAERMAQEVADREHDDAIRAAAKAQADACRGPTP